MCLIRQNLIDLQGEIELYTYLRLTGQNVKKAIRCWNRMIFFFKPNQIDILNTECCPPPQKKPLQIQIVYKHVQKLIFMPSDKDSENYLISPSSPKIKMEI